ncbi:MAG TPA: EscU/YscU/HrcU family type III secretion system export apparatus switch protein [Polyangia bacterium]|nr:EscU/YscU/HrcU family type III secretion system export apparatus switch protein [Polyangia bacterium]
MSGPLPPSPRRLREARARGEVAHAPLLSTTAALAAAALAIAWTAPTAAARLVALARAAWSGTTPATTLAESALATLVRLFAPIAVAALLAAVIGGLTQTRFALAWGALGRRVRGDDEPLPLIGWLAAAATALAASTCARAALAALARSDGTGAALAAATTALAAFVPRALTLLALGGVGELALRQSRLTASLAMTRAERERERREDEGDPRLRAEQRRRQRALDRDPLADELARAQVVVTAEGVAVALRFVDGAARVAVASGDDRLRAQRLSTIARRLGLPIRADDELALALSALPPNSLLTPRWQQRAQAALRSRRR